MFGGTVSRHRENGVLLSI